jgi:hypothetical protein
MDAKISAERNRADIKYCGIVTHNTCYCPIAARSHIMFNTKITSIIVAGAVAIGSAGVAQAGSAKKSPVPGKPGNQTIVQIAMNVNKTGEFDYLLAAATCASAKP